MNKVTETMLEKIAEEAFEDEMEKIAKQRYLPELGESVGERYRYMGDVAAQTIKDAPSYIATLAAGASIPLAAAGITASVINRKYNKAARNADTLINNMRFRINKAQSLAAAVPTALFAGSLPGIVAADYVSKITGLKSKQKNLAAQHAVRQSDITNKYYPA